MVLDGNTLPHFEQKITFLYIDITVKARGRLSEDWYTYENSFDENYISMIEKRVEDKIETDVNQLIHKLQTVYGTGAAGFYEYVKIQQPDFWKKVSGKREEIFREATINYNVDIKVIDFGTKGATN